LSAALVARNLLLAALLAPLLGAHAASVTALQWIDGLGAGLAVYALYQLLDEMLSLRRLSAELRRRFA
jgi:hypothetical protein